MAKNQCCLFDPPQVQQQIGRIVLAPSPQRCCHLPCPLQAQEKRKRRHGKKSEKTKKVVRDPEGIHASMLKALLGSQGEE